MNGKLTEDSSAVFTEKLASAAPVPGGGGAAALAGALGAALCAMAGNLTLGRKKYAEAEPEIRALVERAEAYREELMRLVDRDAEAFAPLAAAWAVPRDEPERPAILLAATRQACTAPLAMMESCCGVIRLLERMLQIGNRALLSDVGCAALFCRSALEAAAMNVFVNTKSIPGDEEAAGYDRAAEALLGEYLPRAQAVAGAVMRELHGEGTWL